MWTKLITSIFPAVAKIIDQAVPDKDLALKLKHDIQLGLLSAHDAELKEAGKVLVAEIQGQSMLQRVWRPATMLIFVSIIANNYIIVPYAIAFGAPVPMLEIPPGMWGLLTVGIGGYVGGRTLEKIRGVE